MPADQKLFVTRIQAGELIQLSARQFDIAIRPKLAKDAKRGSGAKLRYDAAAIVAAFVEYRLEQRAPSVGTGEDDELLNPNVSSPQLERLRKHKADLAERDVKERDRKLVRRDLILNALMPALSGMRGAGDRLTLGHGNEAGAIYNEAVDDFEAALVQAIKAAEENDEAAK